MKSQSYLFGIVVVLFALAAIGGTTYLAITSPKTANILVDSFETCVGAGYPVMESYPEQCKTPDGKTYVRAIPEQTLPEKEVGTNASTTLLLPTLTTPLSNSQITSPLKVSGSAVGNWYFEASFPVILKDANGNVLAESPAQAQGDWMTTDAVPFVSTLTWGTTTATSGVLILKRDNPSGLPENDNEVSFPVLF
jgi:hypothetical protein